MSLPELWSGHASQGIPRDEARAQDRVLLDSGLEGSLGPTEVIPDSEFHVGWGGAAAALLRSTG